MVEQEFKLVLVVWEDAGTVDDGTWVERANITAAVPIMFEQVGWLVNLDEREAVLSHCVGAQFIACRERIPRGMVHSIHELKTGKALVPARRK